MPRAFLGLFLALLICPPTWSQEAKISLEAVYGRKTPVRYGGRIPHRARWAPDGIHLVIDKAWVEPLSSKVVKAPPPPAPSPLAGRFRKTLEKAGLKPPKASRPIRSTVPRHAEANPGVLRAGETFVALIDNDLYAWSEGKKLLRLSFGAKPKRRIQLSPDGRALSYVEGYDLFIVRCDDGRRFACSTDGGEKLFYGELDWVYQEEVYGRFDFQAAWWSDSGSHLAFLRTDEEGVPTFTVVDHIPTHLGIEHLKYPKTGDPNPSATLWVANAENGSVSPIDLGAYKGQEILIVRVAWTPDGRLIYQVQDREQTWLDLVVADPGSGKSTRLIREKSETWVNILDGLHWLKDGGFLWESERSGMRHLYRYDSSGKLMGAVTSGPWQLRSVLQVDEERGEVVFEGTRDGAIQRNHYIASLSGKPLRRLTCADGSHQISFNRDGSLLIDTFSSLRNPGEQRLVTRNGRVLSILGRSPLPKAAKTHGYSMPELVSVPARDGYEMDATILKPHAFDPSKSWPVWFETYSGPDAPTVRDRWNSSAWHQFLAQRGYIVFQLNVRSASGRGQSHTAKCYQRLGVAECRDIEDGLKWLCDHSWADADRVGMTGWSFGGFITAFTMTHTKLIKLGVAGGGVYTWRDYDTIYTERYMRTPQHNPKGYAETSVLESAAELSGHLVIVHGTMDDNVHLQNAMQFVYRLQQAGQSFDLMVYPKNRHGIRNREQFWHWRSLLWDKIRTHLPAGPIATTN